MGPNTNELVGMDSRDIPNIAEEVQTFADSKFGPQAVMRLRAAFDRSQNPMLIADDQRRWVTGNDAACELLGIARQELTKDGIEHRVGRVLDGVDADRARRPFAHLAQRRQCHVQIANGR